MEVGCTVHMGGWVDGWMDGWTNKWILIEFNK